MDVENSTVIGAGMLFMASGCGSLLTKEQQEFLRTVKPDEQYSVAELAKILHTAHARSPELMLATGRRWGSANVAELEKRGITSIKEALKALPGIYAAHHKGDAGKITYEDAGENAVTLTDDTPYPHEVLWGGAIAIATALGAEDVQVEQSDDPMTATIRWEMEV